MDRASWRDLRVDRFGERALLVGVGDQARVQALAELLLPALERGPLEDVIPGDATLLIEFDGSDAGERRARRLLRRAVQRSGDPAWLADRPVARSIVIPVRYGGPDGPDLNAAAALVGCSPSEFVRRHADGEHSVRFLGFAPGFPYIGGLPDGLVVPRLATPRTTTPAGSVAVAERYTGIYPAELPGGWRVIGWTPMRLFDPAEDPPAFLRPGDRVRFEAI